MRVREVCLYIAQHSTNTCLPIVRVRTVRRRARFASSYWNFSEIEIVLKTIVVKYGCHVSCTSQTHDTVHIQHECIHCIQVKTNVGPFLSSQLSRCFPHCPESPAIQRQCHEFRAHFRCCRRDRRDVSFWRRPRFPQKATSAAAACHSQLSQREREREREGGRGRRKRGPCFVLAAYHNSQNSSLTPSQSNAETEKTR